MMSFEKSKTTLEYFNGCGSWRYYLMFDTKKYIHRIGIMMNCKKKVLHIGHRYNSPVGVFEVRIFIFAYSTQLHHEHYIKYWTGIANRRQAK